MAKDASAEASMEAAEACLQTHGGSGYVHDVGVYDIYQACRLLRSAPVNRERRYASSARGHSGYRDPTSPGGMTTNLSCRNDVRGAAS